jgi:hypothetical protein
MLEVNPLADVPRTNLNPVFKRLQLCRKPTDAEDSTHGKGHYAFASICHWAGLYIGATETTECPSLGLWVFELLHRGGRGGGLGHGRRGLVTVVAMCNQAEDQRSG